MQLVVAVALLHLAASMGMFQLPTIEWQKCKNVMPLILINAIGLSANTYCLQEVDASLFQVGRTLRY
jgi:GDP-fucose transporter C1